MGVFAYSPFLYSFSEKNTKLYKMHKKINLFDVIFLAFFHHSLIDFFVRIVYNDNMR